jgi:protein gp37
MSKSKIEWTEETWNPIVGCSKVTQGCKHCYAEQQFPRFRNRFGYGDKFTDVRLLENRLDEPLKRKKPTMYFVNSMSDLFHEDLSDTDIEKVFSVMKQAPQHTFQVLTKRAERLPVFFASRQVPDNVWIGVSVENVKQGKPRISLLRKVKAKTRFLSIEPLLEDVGKLNLRGIHWVIVGGESGHKARPMQSQWVENVRVQCEAQKVPFFFKQWGAWGADGVKRPKSGNGSLLDGKSYKEYPIPKKTVAKPMQKPSVVHGKYDTYEEIKAAVKRGDITKGSAAAFKAWVTMRNGKGQANKGKVSQQPSCMKYPVHQKACTEAASVPGGVVGRYGTHEEVEAAVKQGLIAEKSAPGCKAWVTRRNRQGKVNKGKVEPCLWGSLVRLERTIPGANFSALISVKAGTGGNAGRIAREAALNENLPWDFDITDPAVFMERLAVEVIDVVYETPDEEE